MSGQIKINNATVKAPKEVEVTIMDLDSESSTRTANGEMFRDRIAVKRKVKIKWGPLSDSEISGILGKMTSTFFPVTYPDPLTGSQQTKTFYVGDRSVPVYSFHNSYNAYKWNGLNIELTEK